MWGVSFILFYRINQVQKGVLEGKTAIIDLRVPTLDNRGAVVNIGSYTRTWSGSGKDNRFLFANHHLILSIGLFCLNVPRYNRLVYLFGSTVHFD